jgi:hypothetical protein
MRKNNRMQVVALQTSIGTLTSEKLALQTALAELGYCHEQQTKFITDSMSGADGAISRDILFAESKAALAEAVETNKRLTDDLEFQEFRYEGQKKALGQANKTCASLASIRDSLECRLKWAKITGLGACALAIGQALQNAGLITPFIG